MHPKRIPRQTEQHPREGKLLAGCLRSHIDGKRSEQTAQAVVTSVFHHYPFSLMESVWAALSLLTVKRRGMLCIDLYVRTREDTHETTSEQSQVRSQRGRNRPHNVGWKCLRTEGVRLGRILV
jgi:hypothetical protein